MKPLSPLKCWEWTRCHGSLSAWKLCDSTLLLQGIARSQMMGTECLKESLGGGLLSFLNVHVALFSSTEDVSFGTIRRKGWTIPACDLWPVREAGCSDAWGCSEVCCLTHLSRAALTVVPSFASTVLVYPALYPWGPFQLWSASILFSFTIHSFSWVTSTVTRWNLTKASKIVLEFSKMRICYLQVHLLAAWAGKCKPELCL